MTTVGTTTASKLLANGRTFSRVQFAFSGREATATPDAKPSPTFTRSPIMAADYAAASPTASQALMTLTTEC